MFKLKQPCGTHCPFHASCVPFLTRGRVLEIAVSLKIGESFHCHKTISYGEDDEGRSVREKLLDEQHCAGAILVLLNDDTWNTAMQLGERFQAIFPELTALHFHHEEMNREYPVFPSLVAFIMHHSGMDALDSYAWLRESVRKRRTGEEGV